MKLLAPLLLALSLTDGGAQVAAPPPVEAVAAFGFADVELLDGPFRQAMLRNADYLLSLDPDRLLHNARQYAGLPPKAPRYGGWESTGVGGHILGHLLTAASQQYAATRDPRFLKRINYIVSELALCQKAYGDGYVGALPPVELATLRGFGKGIVDMKDPETFVGGAWAPWYTEHKILNGLKDAWILAGNAQARDVALRLADWFGDMTARLAPGQLQAMLEVEQGGVVDVLAELSALTGNPRYMETARRFRHRAILDPLLAGRDQLPGRHANTQIPKIIGEARTYEVTGDLESRKIAENFWDAVVHHHSYVIGGNSYDEHFFKEAETPSHIGACSAETCNTYNMLKLTEHIFSWQPREECADFYERALYNDILASQEPKRGMFTYFMSLKPGHFKVYSTPENSFWCCVGTGMENHSKYGDTIYFHDADSLYVNLFIASELSWPEKGLVVRQETQFPETDATVLKIKAQKPVSLALKIRHPAWAVSGLSVAVNGVKQSVDSAPESYFTLSREWHDGDKIEIRFPMALHTEPLPGASNTVAILYGPIVLAGEMGTNAMPYPFARNQTDFSHLPAPAAPVLVSAAEKLLQQIKPVAGKSLTFQTHGIGQPRDVTLIPFYQLHRERYSVYWKLFSADEWQAQVAELASAEASRIAAEARVVDAVRVGEQQSETDHKLQGGDTQSGDFSGRKWRHASDWFSYEVKVLPDQPVQLACTFWGSDDGAREFDVVVEGKTIGTEKLTGNRPGEFFDATFPLPAELTQGKDKVAVKFVAHPGNLAGGVFGVSILRKQMELK